jgi:hypothetical protein
MRVSCFRFAWAFLVSAHLISAWEGELQDELLHYYILKMLTRLHTASFLLRVE